MNAKFENILVTGSTGFIGRNLVRKLLSNGKNVSILVRNIDKAKKIFSGLDVKVCDRTDSVQKMAEFMKTQSVQCVVHLATCYVTKNIAEDIEPLVDGNIAFGLRVLEAMKEAEVHDFVNASTSWQHYCNERYNPVNLYAATKQAFEDLLLYYIKVEGMRAITLELYDTYGSGDERNKLIPYWEKASVTGERILMSAGDQKISYVYIEDVVEAFCRALELLSQNDYFQENFCVKYGVFSDEVVSLRELASIYQEVYKKRLNIEWGAVPYREREVWEPYKGTEKVPGWNAQYSLYRGIQEMCNFNQK